MHCERGALAVVGKVHQQLTRCNLLLHKRHVEREPADATEHGNVNQAVRPKLSIIIVAVLVPQRGRQLRRLPVCLATSMRVCMREGLVL